MAIKSTPPFSLISDVKPWLWGISGGITSSGSLYNLGKSLNISGDISLLNKFANQASGGLSLNTTSLSWGYGDITPKTVTVTASCGWDADLSGGGVFSIGNISANGYFNSEVYCGNGSLTVIKTNGVPSGGSGEVTFRFCNYNGIVTTINLNLYAPTFP